MHCEFLQRRASILAHFRLDPLSGPLWSWEPKSAESPWTWQRSPECAVYEISWKLLKWWCFGNGFVKFEVMNSIHHNERPHGPESNLSSVVCTMRGWMNQKKLHRGAPDPSAESSSPSFFHLLHMWGPDFCEVVFCCGRLPSRYQPDSIALIFLSVPGGPWFYSHGPIRRSCCWSESWLTIRDLALLFQLLSALCTS